MYLYIEREERGHLCLEERKLAAVGGLDDGCEPDDQS